MEHRGAPVTALRRKTEFLYLLWMDIISVGRVTSDVAMGMSLTQFIGVALIVIVAPRGINRFVGDAAPGAENPRITQAWAIRREFDS